MYIHQSNAHPAWRAGVGIPKKIEHSNLLQLLAVNSLLEFYDHGPMCSLVGLRKLDLIIRCETAAERTITNIRCLYQMNWALLNDKTGWVDVGLIETLKLAA